jgi:ATP-dependent Clp protease adaptor protein ClpS
MKFSPEKRENINVPDVKRSLILHNDSKNTFDFIIESLVELCHHDPYQASQCAVIAHYKGKCEIKKGNFEELKILEQRFLNKGITVTIE